MLIFLEKTTGLLVPGGTAPAWPRAAVLVNLAFLASGVAELVPGGAVSLKLYSLDDLVTPVATYAAWTEDAPQLQYTATLDVSALSLPTYIAKVEYGAGPTISQAFQVRIGAASATVPAPTPITIVYNIGGSSGSGGPIQEGSITLGANLKSGSINFAPALDAIPARVEAIVEPPNGAGAVLVATTHTRTTAGCGFLLSGRTPDAAHVLRWAAYA